MSIKSKVRKTRKITSALFGIAWSSLMVYVYVHDIGKKAKQIRRIAAA